MIGIIGYGYVGQATHKLLGDVDVIIDIDSGPDQWDLARQCDILFVCVPTPADYDKGSCDTSILDQVLERGGRSPIYVVRSTVPWTYQDDLYRLVAAPEFLNQNEFLEAEYNQLLGGLYNDVKDVAALYDSRGIKYTLTTWDAAWQTKYASNLYGAFKVLFWEMIQDITGNERLVYRLFKSLGLPQHDMAQVGMDGERGYGGACLPKDVKAVLALTDHPVIRMFDQYNKSLRGGADDAQSPQD